MTPALAAQNQQPSSTADKKSHYVKLAYGR